MAKKLDFKNIVEYRRELGVNQSTFWSRFGVTQSGGSRYETGRSLPKSVAMLVWLRDKNKITDKDLEDALKTIKKG
jgi:DNA-binding transcriptional regulator YiaG